MSWSSRQSGSARSSRRSDCSRPSNAANGSAPRAAFDGTVIAANEALERRSKLLNEDAFGAGWMLVVRAASEAWRDRLVTGSQIAPAFAAWIAEEAYKGRAE